MYLPVFHQYSLLYPHSLHLINTPIYTYTAYISLNPRIYLESLHLINPPLYLLFIHPLTYTYTAGISFIPPHIPKLPASHSSPHIYLHCLHLIKSCLYLESLHLINPPHNLHFIHPPTYSYTAGISFIPPHIPKLLASHLSPHI